MKTVRKLIGLTGLCALLAGGIGISRRVEAKGKGYIEVTSATIISIDVRGESQDREDWVGCTLYNDDGKERDLHARKVSGEFDESFPVGISSIDARNYAVALWNRKVENCGCEYCRKSGYHLEDRIDRKSGKIYRGGW